MAAAHHPTTLYWRLCLSVGWSDKNKCVILQLGTGHQVRTNQAFEWFCTSFREAGALCMYLRVYYCVRMRMIDYLKILMPPFNLIVVFIPLSDWNPPRGCWKKMVVRMSIRIGAFPTACVHGHRRCSTLLCSVCSSLLFSSLLCLLALLSLYMLPSPPILYDTIPYTIFHHA